MPTIQDDRTPQEIEKTRGFWVATDKFMWGWGDAKNGRSIVACPFVSIPDAKHIERMFNDRPDFLRVRIAWGKAYRPKLGQHDHLHIYDTVRSFRPRHWADRGGV